MTPVAALDVGTNTVQMVVAVPRAGGTFEVLAERAAITRLGRGVDATGRLGDEGIARAVAAIHAFTSEARANFGVTTFAACATSASRDASNGHVLQARVRTEAGIHLEIIAGEEEARLAFLAVQGDFGGHPGSALVAIDVGGGSTEIVIGPSTGGSARPTFRHSAQVGSVRLAERFGETDLKQMRRAADEAFSQTPPLPADADGTTTVVAVAATATSLYAVSEALASSHDPRVQGGVLRRAVIDETVERLASMPLEARRQVRGLDPARAEVICAGGVVLSSALAALGAERCRVSDRGLRWGILRDRFTLRLDPTE